MTCIRRSIFVAVCLLGAAACFAEDPVAFVMQLSGSYSCTDSAGNTTALAVKSPLYNGSVVSRTTESGFLVYLDANGRVSPNIVDPQLRIKGQRGIDAKKQGIYLSYIGGTMARSGKGAAAEGLFAWGPEIGAVMEKDVRDGAMALVFGSGPDSAETGRYLPLSLRVAPRYTLRRIDYRIVQNTLVMAEGQVSRRGEEWVLPLAELGDQTDETVPLSLTFTVLDSADRTEKSFTMDAPYTVMADDGFIEDEIKRTSALLSQGVDDPDAANIERMAKLSVYGEYRLNLYALALQSARR